MSEPQQPLLDRREAERINLAVLKKLDPQTEEVLAIAGHVSLYGFDKNQSAWARRDVEGSLFLIKRNTAPRFRFIILNKKSTNNFREDIEEGFSHELQEPYIMYHTNTDQVSGIWFYDTAECHKVDDLLQRIESGMRTVHARSRSSSQGQPIPAAAVPTAPASNLATPSNTISPPAEALPNMQPPPQSSQPGSQPEQVSEALLRLFSSSNIKSSGSTPANESATSSSAQPAQFTPPPASTQPLVGKLLKPSFFTQSSPAAQSGPGARTTQVQPAIPFSNPTAQLSESQGNVLHDLFARAMPTSGQTPNRAGGHPTSVPPRPVPAAQTATTQDRDPSLDASARVRQAVKRVVQSDTFIDLITRELMAEGLK
ncbi:hypothetical protein WJX74_005190 [Apatococcus lobatus]|uniref:mRNA-decapping enzyme-like protein n=2 Tax=Apatococcus TaxID=904362 RepID=A0AAW1SNX6_9CHLO